MGIWRVNNLLFLKYLNLRSKQPLFNTPLRPLLKFAFLSSPPSSEPAISSIALRFLSANTSSCYAYDFDHKYASDSMEEEETGKIPVKAYFLSTSIDLKSMQAANLSNVIPATSRSSNYIALRYCDYSAEIYGVGVEESANFCRYMVVFQYGSAVLFNIADDEVEEYLEIVRRHASGLLSEVRRDDYAIKEKKLLAEDMKGGPDYIVLKKLDADGIRIIGSVLGQSIALDYFVSQVDGMVEEFTDINRDMEKRGTFTMERKKLFQLVGKANSNLADVILKVGLFDRSEIAWRDAKYSQMLEYLREEYEFTQRFGNLVFKLKFVEHNIHFLQEVLQNRRSDLSDWCIVLLLSIENVISIYIIIHESTALPL